MAAQYAVLGERIQFGDCVTGRRHPVTTSSFVQGTVVSGIWAVGGML